VADPATEQSNSQVMENIASTPDLFPTIRRLMALQITRKRTWHILLNLLWFVFIMMVVGQLGVVLAIGVAFWNDTSIREAVIHQANSGNLMTFAVAVLAASGYFMVREFHGESGIQRRHTKSVLLLLSIAFGLAGALIAASLTVPSAKSMTELQLFWHWILYLTCIGLALFWWALEELQGSVGDLAGEVADSSKSMTDKAKPALQQTSTNLKV
jgi:hypothetical protein